MKNQLSFFPEKEPFKAKLVNWRITGFHKVFGPVYDSVGFPGNLLRDLVITRIVCQAPILGHKILTFKV